MEKSQCFGESSIFAVELPVAEYEHPYVIIAKGKEFQSLQACEIFEEVEGVCRKLESQECHQKEGSRQRKVK